MNKILFISHNQFGYQIDMFNYIKYLSDFYDIEYFCFDYRRERLKINNVNIFYIEKTGSKIRQLIHFLNELIKHLKIKNYNLVILKHFPFSSIIKIFTKDKVLLNIQTGAVSNNKAYRLLFNTLLKLETKIFRHIMILSESLRELLEIPLNKTTIIPLGAEAFCEKNYNYERLDLIYIGTLNGRNIYKTIIGFNKFYQKNKNNIKTRYTIIGFGSKKEESKLLDLIRKYNLENVVKFVGLVSYNELPEYIKNCNIGVSFVPITEYYDVQPPSKTIEYLLSGLPTIATATKENKKLINNSNGVLIDDTIDGFYMGLEQIKKQEYDNALIRKNMVDYKWENIIDQKLKPLIENIINESNNKPKIAVIGLKGLPAFGGAAAVGENIIEQLKDRYDFTVYSTSSHTELKTGEYNGYKQIVFKKFFINFVNTFFYYSISGIYILLKKYDFVHIHHIDGAFIIPLIKRKNPVILTSHGRPQDNNKWTWFVRKYFSIMENIALKYATVFISVSKSYNDIYQKLGRIDSLYIPNAILNKNIIDKDNCQMHASLVFAAGRIIPLKGCHLVLEALRMCNISINLKVIGDLTHSSSYRHKLYKLGVSLDINYLGFIKDKKILFKEIRSSKLFVFPSTVEAMSMMLLEVASNRVPIICSNIDSNRSVFSDDEVLFFNSGDSNDLHEKIMWAYCNYDEMIKKSNNALIRLQNEYNWCEVGEKYNKIFDSLREK